MMSPSDLYDQTAMEISRMVTLRYSTSFGWSTRLIASSIRQDIFAIYGLVRIADEIVDTYKGKDARMLLDGLEQETYDAMDRKYSTNPVIHAFQLTANRYAIDKALIEPFFESMRVDCAAPKHFTKDEYTSYIYGSAEVVGLMCLRVFVAGNDTEYERLQYGAARLGSAYQKVNFLRDFAVDSTNLKRLYFPGVMSADMNQEQKNDIINDIANDFDAAKPYVDALPRNCRTAVAVSCRYYEALLHKLRQTSPQTISQQRIRISDGRKLWLAVCTMITYIFLPMNEELK